MWAQAVAVKVRSSIWDQFYVWSPLDIPVGILRRLFVCMNFGSGLRGSVGALRVNDTKGPGAE